MASGTFISICRPIQKGFPARFSLCILQDVTGNDMLISLRACAVDAIDRENYIQLCMCVWGETQSPVKNKGYTWVAQHVRLETCNPVQRLMNHGA